MKTVRLGLAQINTTVGDIEGNLALIREGLAEARAAGCHFVAFPELAVTGYPPEDLVLRRSFCERSREAALSLAPQTGGLIAVIGFVDWQDGDAYNAAGVFIDGKLVDVYHKRRLPNYGVFDEQRYFAAGNRTPIYQVGELTFGVSICEDIWYPGAPLDAMALGGAELCVNINGSPYHRSKSLSRERMLATRAADNLIAVAYVNMVGGQDELVFDGASVVFDAEGQLIARARQFEEELLVADIDLDAVAQRRLHDPRRRVELQERQDDLDYDCVTAGSSGLPAPFERQPAASQRPPLLDDHAEIWAALVLGTRDYMRKTGFEQALISLSGGIDSSIVAAIAVEAIGAANVLGVLQPSRYSSQHSVDDALELVKTLGIRHLVVPIEPAHAAMLEMLAGAFEGTEPGTAEENLQSRQRGNVMMTLSNKLARSLVLSTGNKSEMAVGYATLYGDMAGGYAVVKDVPKTLLFELCRWRNSLGDGPVIPPQVITKPPSAELKPNQLDTDSLPPYEILDPIIEAYAEDDRTVAEIVAMGFDDATVRRVVRMIDRNEYKRRQAPPGVKITQRAFGRDRRLPLAAKLNH